MSATTINSILTALSIAFSLLSFWNHHRVKQIKQQVHQKLDTIEMLPKIEAFSKEYQKLTDKQKGKDSPIDSSAITQRAASMARRLNRYLPLLDVETRKSVERSCDRIKEEDNKVKIHKNPDINSVLVALDKIDKQLQAFGNKIRKE